MAINANINDIPATGQISYTSPKKFVAVLHLQRKDAQELRETLGRLVESIVTIRAPAHTVQHEELGEREEQARILDVLEVREERNLIRLVLESL